MEMYKQELNVSHTLEMRLWYTVDFIVNIIMIIIINKTGLKVCKELHILLNRLHLCDNLIVH